jgi:hypothetical protein
MKKVILYAAAVILFTSCTRHSYSFTENDITTTGVQKSGHHIETISTARIRTLGSK